MVNPKYELEEFKKYTEKVIDIIKKEKFIEHCDIFHYEESKIHIVIKSFNEGTCFLELELLTFNKYKQLTVSLKPQTIDQQFDQFLYKSKFLLKDILIKDWIECVWIEDQQSMDFSNDLYKSIHSVENDLRNFINISMIRYFGIKWWENYVPNEIKIQYLNGQKNFKRVATSYSNVNDNLLGINTIHLTSIMKHKKMKLKNNSNQNITSHLYSLKNNGDLNILSKEINKFLSKLKEEHEVELDLWDYVFSKYFEGDFVHQHWREFSDNRNHIAHNKLLDLEAYNIIKNNINTVSENIKEAQKKFDATHISEEETAIMLRLQDNLDLENENSSRNRKEYESGVKILDTSSIIKEYGLLTSDLIEEFKDVLYFRGDLEIITMQLNEESLNGELIRIESKLNSNVLSLIIDLNISEGSGSQSTANFRVLINDEPEEDIIIYYNNGEVTFNEDLNLYEAVKFNEFEPDNADNVLSFLEDKVEEIFPNLKDRISLAAYTAIKDGGNNPIAEFSCEECNEDTVCIDSEIAELGRCISCGNQHEVNACERCGYHYNVAAEGTSYLCEGCYDYYDAQ